MNTAITTSPSGETLEKRLSGHRFPCHGGRRDPSSGVAADEVFDPANEASGGEPSWAIRRGHGA